MSNFINCPQCQQQMHDSAPACPNCGAPNQAVKTASYTSYDQVPWYRRRWALVLSAFIFMPIALVIAFSGDVYFFKDGKVQTFPKNFKFTLLVIFGLLVLTQIYR